MSKKANCEKCVHLPLCEYCAELTSFRFPDELRGECDMMNSDFDDVEEAVSNAMIEANRNMNDPDNDREKFLFFKGRWSAFKDVLGIMSNYGEVSQ